MTRVGLGNTDYNNPILTNNSNINNQGSNVRTDSSSSINLSGNSVEDKTGLERLSLADKEYLEAYEKYAKSGKSGNNAETQKIGTVKYNIKDNAKAEDNLSGDILSKDAVTFSKSQQKELLKEAGIDVDKLKDFEAEDGTVSFGANNTYYRVVDDNGKVKIIHTTIEKDTASTSVYEFKNPKSSHDKFKPEDGNKWNSSQKKAMEKLKSGDANSANTTNSTNPTNSTNDNGNTVSSGTGSANISELQAKVTKLNSYMSKIDEQLSALNSNKPDKKADKAAYTEWSQQKKLLQKEKNAVKKELDDAQSKLLRAKLDSGTLNTNNNEINVNNKGVKKKKNDIENIMETLNKGTKMVDGLSKLWRSLDTLFNGGKRRY